MGLTSVIPNTTLNSLPQVSPQAKFRKGLHDSWPTTPNTVVESLRLCDGSSVKETKELRSIALGSAVVCGAKRHAGIEFYEV